MSVVYLDYNSGDRRMVHYEVTGRGEPVIFLHSWMGSWRYWAMTMDELSDRYRTYALDFWGFGESDRRSGPFIIPEYVNMLHRFMKQIGIAKANLVGHGLGGMVAIHAAQEYPELFLRLMIVSTPVDGAVLKGTLKPGTFSRLLGLNNPASIWTKVVRQIPVEDEEIQQELYEDTDNLSERVIQSVQESILDTDLQPALSQLHTIPLLAVYGEKDTIVPHDHAQYLKDDNSEMPHQLIVLPQTHHFPFLEQSNTFNRLLRDFLGSKGEPVEIKNQWRRRVSQREYL